MLLRNSKQSPLRKIAGGASAVALVLAGLAATASYGYAAHDAKSDGDDKIQKRVMVIGGDEDMDFVMPMVHGGDFQIITQDGDSEDMQFVMPMMHGGDYEIVSPDGDGEHRIFKYVTPAGSHGQHIKMMGMGDCTAKDGENEPVKLEWSAEDGDMGDVKARSIICLSGDEAADPKKRAEMLREAIDQMEENAKKQEARRKKMIAGLRKQLRELEKKN